VERQRKQRLKGGTPRGLQAIKKGKRDRCQEKPSRSAVTGNGLRGRNVKACNPKKLLGGLGKLSETVATGKKGGRKDAQPRDTEVCRREKGGGGKKPRPDFIKNAQGEVWGRLEKFGRRRKEGKNQWGEGPARVARRKGKANKGGRPWVKEKKGMPVLGGHGTREKEKGDWLAKRSQLWGRSIESAQTCTMVPVWEKGCTRFKKRERGQYLGDKGGGGGGQGAERENVAGGGREPGTRTQMAGLMRGGFIGRSGLGANSGGTVRDYQQRRKRGQSERKVGRFVVGKKSKAKKDRKLAVEAGALRVGLNKAP